MRRNVFPYPITKLPPKARAERLDHLIEEEAQVLKLDAAQVVDQAVRKVTSVAGHLRRFSYRCWSGARFGFDAVKGDQNLLEVPG